jgi:hypothetical protein
LGAIAIALLPRPAKEQDPIYLGSAERAVS